MNDRCNRPRCPLARLSGLQCFSMGHNGHGINLYGVVMILMGNLYAGGQLNLGHLSLVHPVRFAYNYTASFRSILRVLSPFSFGEFINVFPHTALFSC